MPAKILVADDDVVVLDMLINTLQEHGFEVIAATDGESALQMARRQRPDLVLLDVMMPRLLGFEVCRELRRESNVPILMLTARDAEDDHIFGLDQGADDYIAKPFRAGELLARIRASLRRAAAAAAAAAQPPGDVAQLGDLVIDRRRHAVSRGATVVNLSQREYDLLLALLDAHGAAMPRNQLLAKVWGEGWIGDQRTLDVHIRWLREKLEAQPAHPQLLLTVRNVGYRLVSADELPPAAPLLA